MTDRAQARYATRLAVVVALGGFLMGFDAAVISGVVGPVDDHFDLSSDQLGWVVACLTLSSAIAMALAGPLADRFGRRLVLFVTAALFTVSAVGSALAESYTMLWVARVVGGFGVGGALLIAPVYIAEIAPPERRGQLVSFNQLNIVLGLSAAFFSNYFLERFGLSWRWMLGVEAVPAVVYGALLLTVPRSPRWLLRRGHAAEARQVLDKVCGSAAAASAVAEVEQQMRADAEKAAPRPSELFTRRMRRVLWIGLGLAFFQQITGINAIFFYSPTIFGLAGAARDVQLVQAIWIGLVNVAFTLVAMRLIDRLGRKPLLMIGSALMALALLTNGAAFRAATYELSAEALTEVTAELPADVAPALQPLVGVEFDDQRAFVAALRERTAPLPEAVVQGLSVDDVAKQALQIDSAVVLAAILLYIAAFAISLGPVMWAMFSEIFPQRLRGMAISLAGFVNSTASFAVQQLFPRGLESLGPANVFFVFGGFAVLAFLFAWRVVPETKGRSLEELERELAR